jgi:L-malate glycosyltransferase
LITCECFIGAISFSQIIIHPLANRPKMPHPLKLSDSVKKNVLQFIGSFHQGGSERQAVQLTRLLARDDRYNVFIATLNAEGILRRVVEELGFEQIPEFKLTSFYDSNFLRQLSLCKKFLRENQIDIVQTHDFYTNIFGIAAARLARVPIKIASKRETEGVRTKLQKILEKQVFRWADAIVANSQAVESYLIAERIRAEKIKVIYNGLDLERLKPNPMSRAEICEKLGLPDGENIKFITLVANLRHTVKNHPMCLRAAKKVLVAIPNAHFVIAGEGELKEDLTNLARELGVIENVHFIGRCEMIAELLAVSFACVLCSYAEGFSNSILEYMAAGKPVVATDVGGAREAIVEGVNGFLVDSDDDESMANGLIDLLQNEKKAREFGEAGRRMVEENFSVAAQLERTIELYQSASDER